MLRELISILRTKDPLQAVGENFARMLHLTYEMTLVAGDIYFGKKYDPADRSQIYRQDVEVNQLERTIRQQVVAHLSIQKSSSDLPYCLLLMSLVKDVERLGDYAKNLTEIQDICSHPLPDDDIKQELLEIRSGVEKAFQSTADVHASSDQERALQFIREGRSIAHRCRALLRRIAARPAEPCVITAEVLGCRYYKRIGGHVLNILSSVVMPLHKIDYYDEDEIARIEAPAD